jgi:3-deoxy-D-manno-octulosonate 8-phosphate phosphatase (KDO 8-P phosphatase)
MTNFKESLRNVKAFVFDVDGVFTDGTVYLDPGGEMVRSMNIKDGYAVQYCIKKGYPVGIISGGNSESVRERFRRLGITDIYLKSHNKMDDFKDFMFKYSLMAEQILYMGDDIPDHQIMSRVGVPTCPADAVQEIKMLSTYISDKNGGQGCVRDVVEQVMKLHGTWMSEEAFQW